MTQSRPTSHTPSASPHKYFHVRSQRRDPASAQSQPCRSGSLETYSRKDNTHVDDDVTHAGPNALRELTPELGSKALQGSALK